MSSDMIERRVKFDFEVEFANGGGIQGQDFRLDIDGEDIDDRVLADLIVKDLRLLMVKDVRILNKHIIRAPHKRTGGATTAQAGIAMDFIDLSHTIEDGIVTYRGLPAPVVCDFLPAIASPPKYMMTFKVSRLQIAGTARVTAVNGSVPAIA